jgi:autotransporter-associated beta strand protein
LFNYTGSTTGFADANSWINFSGRLIIVDGSEFQTIRNGATAMGTAQVILGDATTSGKLSQIEGNWTWTNNIELVGSANEIINNSGSGSARSLKLQGVLSGSGNIVFKDATGFMTGDTGFILTGTNTMSGNVTVDAFVRVGGITGDNTSTAAGTGGTLGTADVVINSGKRLTFSRSDSHTVSNTISGAGSIHVGSTGITGTNTQILTLTGTNSYTGATNVNVGTLLINGDNSSATGAVTVASGATLGGTGTVGGAITVNGSIAPGTTGIGTLNASSNVTWNSGNAWKFDLSSSDDTSDQLAVTGAFTKGTGDAGTFKFDFMGSTPVWNTVYTLATFASTDFTLSDFDLAGSIATLGSGSYSTSSFTVTGTTLTFTAVPEPSTALAGLLLTAGLLRRRRREREG